MLRFLLQQKEGKRPNPHCFHGPTFSSQEACEEGLKLKIFSTQCSPRMITLEIIRGFFLPEFCARIGGLYSEHDIWIEQLKITLPHS